MDMGLATYLGLLVLGGGVGIVSGLLGIGGGVIVVPLLTLLFGMTPKSAAGTSLAMLMPPASFFALRRYWLAGHINIPAALTLAAGFAIGSYIGAELSNSPRLPADLLRQLFAYFLLYLAAVMLFRGDDRVWAVVRTIALLGFYTAARLLFHFIGRRWEKQFAISDLYARRLTQHIEHDYVI